MSTQKSQIFSTKQEMLNALAERALFPKNFARLDYHVGKESFTSYVAEEPLKVSDKFSYQDVDYVRHDGAVVNLNSLEQVYLNSILSKRFGLGIRHGTLREQKEAAHSKDAGYKNKVQIPYWVFTGQVLRNLGETYEVRKAVGTKFVRQTKPTDVNMVV